MQERKNAMDREFQEIIKAVSEVTGLSANQILCKRRFQETTDARWMVVQIMRENGFYTSRIAEHLSMTTRNVNHILFSLSMRLDGGDHRMRNNLERIRKQLGNIRETSSVNG